MRISIEREKCVGHARCAAIAPSLYPLDDGGYIATAGFEVPPGHEALAQRGARACPERIVTVIADASAPVQS